jgi:hypothetical protein
MVAAKKPKGRRKARRKNADFVERAIYDGTKLLGSFAPAKEGFAAWDRKGKRLGAFDTIDEARLAISASAR